MTIFADTKALSRRNRPLSFLPSSPLLYLRNFAWYSIDYTAQFIYLGCPWHWTRTKVKALPWKAAEKTVRYSPGSSFKEYEDRLNFCVIFLRFSCVSINFRKSISATIQSFLFTFEFSWFLISNANGHKIRNFHQLNNSFFIVIFFFPI